MKFLYCTLFLSVLFMLASQAKAACNPTACSCQGVPNGLFCGDGLFGCTYGHVYQCGGDGTRSCDFGVRNSCQQCGKLSCP